MTALFAGAITLALTTVMAIAGVGTAFVLIPIFLALIVIFSSRSGFFAHLTLAGVSAPLPAFTVPVAPLGTTLGAWLMTSCLDSRHVDVIGVVLLMVAAKMTWGLLA